MRIFRAIFILEMIILSLTFKVYSQDQTHRNFIDYATNFSRDSVSQIESISFPLMVIEQTDTTFINKENWNYLKYGFGWEFSALLLTDCEPDYNLTFYKLADSVTSYIEFYSALNDKINIFQFVKNGDWKLSKVALSDSDSRSEETIFSFFKEFSHDTSFDSS